MISAILPTFTLRRLVGYDVVVLATVTTGFVGFGVWVHHMFATGLPQLGESYFTASSLIISIPTGLQIFCWVATLWGAPTRFTRRRAAAESPAGRADARPPARAAAAP